MDAAQSHRINVDYRVLNSLAVGFTHPLFVWLIKNISINCFIMHEKPL